MNYEDITLHEIQEEVLRLSHNEENVDMFWKLVSFPIHPQFYRCSEEEQEKLEKLSWKLREISATPEYPEDIKELASASPSPRPGKYFDVVSLLTSFGGRDLVRNNGDRVALNSDTFKGKYVTVCCFHVPNVSDHGTIQMVVNLCNELYATRDDFEMVMVARMNTLADECEVFDYFFSGFPESCLAVPFEDKHRRDYICKVLDLDYNPRDCKSVQCLTLNSEGRVFSSSYGYLDNLGYYGAEAFPFRKENIYQSDVECRELIFSDVSLERILRCNDFSPDFVYKTNPREVVSISQLSKVVKNKHVGLYLCSGGDFLLKLLDVYEKCREKHLPFEIVVVYLPFEEQIDPAIFKEKIDGLLHKHGVMGWWCLPFNNSVNWRFRRITQHYYTEGDDGHRNDKLIVVGPGVEHLEMYGDRVIRDFGVDAFPFTIGAGVHVRMKQLREMTIESLFANDDVGFSRGEDRNDVISLKELQGTKIFLYINELLDEESWSFIRLTCTYNEMRAIESHSFEVVFVESPSSIVLGEEHAKILSEMPWYICPKDRTSSTNLEELMKLLEGWPDVLVGFGDDGRVCSVQMYGRDGFGFNDVISSMDDDTLYHDVDSILRYDEFRDREMRRFANPEQWPDFIESDREDPQGDLL